MTYTVYNPDGRGNYVSSDDETYLIGSAIDKAVSNACMAMSDSDYLEIFFSDHGYDISDDDSEGYPAFYRFCESDAVTESFRTAISNMNPYDEISLYGVTIYAEP